jgi:capsular polysaccharide biosynthesis protein
MLILRLKVAAYGVAGSVRRAAARILQRLPGTWRALNLPRKRIRSLKCWVEEQQRRTGWMERCKGVHYEVFRPAQTVSRPQPRRAIGEAIHPSFTAERYHVHNEIFLARIPKARILGPGGTVITHDGGLVEESTWSYGWLQRDRALTSLRLPDCEKLPGIFYTIASLSSEGYWHWISEAMPRLFAIEHLPSDEIRVIVSRDLSDWQKESLDVVGLSHLQFVPLNRRHLELEVLFFPSYVGTPGNPHPWGYNWLRERILGNCTPRRADRRIYITRRGALRRRVANEAELEPILSRYGFEIVEAERLTLRDKRHVFGEAESVIGLHGAGLTNILLAPPGCKVLEIFDPNHMNVNNYAAADVLRQEYWYMVGQAAGRGEAHGATGHDDVYVPASEFEESVKALLAE